MGDYTVFIVIVGVLALIFLYSYYVKQKILKYIKSIYGVAPNRIYDGRDFDRIKVLFETFPKADKDIIDDITWNDLDLESFYKKANHSLSHIGDEYLYRHMRTQNYKNLDRMEKHIKYFMKNPELRLKLQYKLYGINSKGKEKDYDLSAFVRHIGDNSLFSRINIIPFFFIMILGTIFLTLFVMNPTDALENEVIFLGLIVVFLGSVFYYSYFTRKVGEFLQVIKTFTKSINVAKSISKLDMEIFDEEIELLNPVLKKLGFKVDVMNSLASISFFQSEGLEILSFITYYFSLFAPIYLWAIKVMDKNSEDAMRVYEVVGYIEMCIAQGSYRKTVDNYCNPEFYDENEIEFEKLCHPLLKNPVPNSKKISKYSIITGANASGKSTFAKMLAINAVIGQTLNICFGERFALKSASVFTSMNIEDDIETGDSFYIAEIKRLKTFLENSNNGHYKMFFADEILKGTNSVERIAAASTILKKFSEEDCFFCLTTHDIELTFILENYYTNYHFKEITTDDSINYDYILYDGVTTGSNAISLLKFIDYEEEMVSSALESAKYYRENDNWRKLI